MKMKKTFYELNKFYKSRNNILPLKSTFGAKFIKFY